LADERKFDTFDIMTVMGIGVERLAEAIDDLAALDSDTLDDAELREVVVELQRQRARLGAVAARVVGRWDGRAVWSGDQSRSAAHRLARDTRFRWRWLG